MSNGVIVEEDKISTKIIHSVPTTGNPTNISCISWSDDNNVAFITQKGIYIFDIQIHPDTKQGTLQCMIHLISPSDMVNPSLNGASLDVDTDFIFRDDDSNRLELMRILVDRTVVPQMEASSQNFRNFRVAKWSPLFGTEAKPLLVSLTCDNWLQLHRSMDKWRTMVDLSMLWLTHVKEKGWDTFQCTDKTSPEIKMLKDRAYLIGFREFCWSTVFKSFDNTQYYCLLFSVTCSGLLVIWKIREDCLSKDDVVLFDCISTGMDTVTSLAWIPVSEDYGILLIGSQAGTIKVLGVTLTDQVDINSYGYCWEEEDLLRVNLLEGIVMEEDPLVIVVLGFKGPFLCAIMLDLGEDSAMVIRSTKTTESLGQFCTSGIVKMDNNEFLISLLSEGLKKISLSYDTDIDIRITKILHTRRYPKTLYHGLAASANRSLWCVSETIGATSDHLILREPTVSSFFVFPDILINQVISVLGMDQLSLGPCVDILEAYRVLQGDSPIYPIPEVNVKEGNNYVLKFNRWLIMTRLVVCTLNMAEQGRLSAQKTSIELTLQRRQCLRLMEKSLASNQKLEQTMRHSLGLAITWIRNTFTDLSEEETATLDKASYWCGLNQEECRDECPICGDLYSISDPNAGCCQAGHRIPRCCLTLLLCSRIPYRRCEWCRSFACCEEEFPSSSTCIFCDGRFRPVK